MNARTEGVRAVDAGELDFTPQQGEALTSADVERCFRATDFADRALDAAIDAAWNLMENVPHEARPGLVAAHMQASAIAYLAERLVVVPAATQRRNCTRAQ